MTSSLRPFALLVALALGLLPSTALAQSNECFIVAADGGTEQLSSITKDDSAEETVFGAVRDRAGDPVLDIAAVAYDPSDVGTLFASRADRLGDLDETNARYDGFSPYGSATGADDDGSLVTSDIDNVFGLSFDATDGTLYGTENRPGSPSDLLFKINPENGQIVEDGFSDQGGDGDDDEYITIDPVTVDGVTLSDIDDITILPVTTSSFAAGTMLGVATDGSGDPDNNTLVEIDKATGATSPITASFSLDVGNVEGLTSDSEGVLYITTGEASATASNQNSFFRLEAGGPVKLAGPLANANYDAATCLLDPVGVLPVEFAGAPQAQVDGQSIILSWQTLSETNSSHFDVQLRAAGENDFRKAGSRVSDSPQGSSYSFQIDNLDPGTYTLRLKQVDTDNTVSFSETAEAVVGLAGPYALSSAAPNPVRTQASFDLRVKEVQRVSVALYNTLGQRVGVLYEGVVEDGRTFTIDADKLSPGIYFYRVQGESFMDTGRISVVK